MAPGPEVLVPLAVLLPLVLAGAPIAIVAIITYHRRQLRAREICAEMIHDMLQRKMTAQEIELVLAAWSQDRRWAKRILKEMTIKKAS